MKQRIIITVILILTINLIHAQYIEQAKLPKYDCDIKKWKKFESQKFIIVSPNRIDSLLQDRIETHSSWYYDTCLIKQEKELNESDFSKHLWILGSIADYNNWERFKLPISKFEGGFIFNNINFTDSLDGISFVDTNRIVFAGNSNQTIFGLREPDIAYGFDFVVTQKNKKTFFGNFENSKVNWANIESLKQTNYNYIPSDNIDFYISKRFDKKINIDSIQTILTFYAKEFCGIFKIDIPKKKSLALIHQYHDEIANMTAFWDGACGGHIYGFHVWNEIHTEGFNFDLIKHEFGHFLFNENFDYHLPAIIREGVIEYYFNKRDSVSFSKNIEITKLYADSLNFNDFITDEANFFGCGSFKGKGIGYATSGFFVKYIIDNYGIDKFKIFCNQRNHLLSIETIFNKTSKEFINEFKAWINKQ